MKKFLRYLTVVSLVAAGAAALSCSDDDTVAEPNFPPQPGEGQIEAVLSTDPDGTQRAQLPSCTPNMDWTVSIPTGNGAFTLDNDGQEAYSVPGKAGENINTIAIKVAPTADRFTTYTVPVTLAMGTGAQSQSQVIATYKLEAIERTLTWYPAVTEANEEEGLVFVLNTEEGAETMYKYATTAGNDTEVELKTIGTTEYHNRVLVDANFEWTAVAPGDWLKIEQKPVSASDGEDGDTSDGEASTSTVGKTEIAFTADYATMPAVGGTYDVTFQATVDGQPETVATIKLTLGDTQDLIECDLPKTMEYNSVGHRLIENGLGTGIYNDETEDHVWKLKAREGVQIFVGDCDIEEDSYVNYEMNEAEPNSWVTYEYDPAAEELTVHVKPQTNSKTFAAGTTERKAVIYILPPSLKEKITEMKDMFTLDEDGYSTGQVDSQYAPYLAAKLTQAPTQGVFTLTNPNAEDAGHVTLEYQQAQTWDPNGCFFDSSLNSRFIVGGDPKPGYEGLTNEAAGRNVGLYYKLTYIDEEAFYEDAKMDIGFMSNYGEDVPIDCQSYTVYAYDGSDITETNKEKKWLVVHLDNEEHTLQVEMNFDAEYVSTYGKSYAIIVFYGVTHPDNDPDKIATMECESKVAVAASAAVHFTYPEGAAEDGTTLEEITQDDPNYTDFVDRLNTDASWVMTTNPTIYLLTYTKASHSMSMISGLPENGSYPFMVSGNPLTLGPEPGEYASFYPTQQGEWIIAFFSDGTSTDGDGSFIEPGTGTAPSVVLFIMYYPEE